jgi:uncharacterized protein YaeQ
MSKATIYKAELEIVDMDRNYYATHRLTLACHPSETTERLMVRLLAFALNAHERLEFGKGISDSDEPDLWQKGLTGEIELWIELGHPDEKLLARARSAKELGRLADSSMDLQCSIQDGEIWFRDEKESAVRVEMALDADAR